MLSQRNLSLRRARRTGALVCAGAVLGAGAFVYGLAQQSYWALAVPVAIAVLGVLALAFWLGWTINTVRGIPPEADHYAGRRARNIARAICVASVAVAALFAVGVLRQSYWALAVPVAIAVLGLAAMVFWIGWAIVTQRSTLPAAEAQASAGAERADAPPGAAP